MFFLRIEWAHKLSSVNEMFAWSKFRLSSHAKKERKAALKRMANELLSNPLPADHSSPMVVLITRLGRRVLDDDNLATACKHIRDGVAEALGVNDGDTSKVVWAYEQEHSQEYKVRVEIDAHPAAKNWATTITHRFNIKR